MARYASQECEGLEYLELRKRLKEEIRNKMKRESGTTSSSRNVKGSSSKDNFGSFFGPSQPFIAQRVIEESKAILENTDLTAKIMRGSNSNSKPHDSDSVRPNVNTISNAPKVFNGAKTKIQEVRNARDYSFLLSDDAPAPPKPSLPKKISAPNPDSLRAKSLPGDKNLSSNARRNISSSHEGRKSLPGDQQLLKPKSVSTSKQSLSAREYKKEPIRSNVSSHGQPLAQKNLPLKSSAAMTMRKEAPTSDLRRPLPNLPRSNPLKPRPPTISKQALVQKKPSQEFSKPKMIQKQPTSTSLRPAPAKMQKHVLSKSNGVIQKRVVPSSKSQIKQPAMGNPERRPAKRPMRCDEEDGADPILEIRKMFGYNPNKYYDGADDDDDSNMEATFGDIEMEELESARIARMEDEEELRKIEEEERREQLRRKRREEMKRDAKKQKLR